MKNTFTKYELNLLESNGFVEDFYDDDFVGEVEQYSHEDFGWSIVKNKNLVNNMIDCYEDGCRVSIMNELDRDCEFVVCDFESDGVWFAKSIEESIQIFKDEVYVD